MLKKAKIDSNDHDTTSKNIQFPVYQHKRTQDQNLYRYTKYL